MSAAAKGPGFRVVHKKRPVACGKYFHLVVAFLEHNSDESGEALQGKSAAKRVINVLEGRRQTVAGVETCTGVRAAYGSQNGGADAVACDISQNT